MIVDTNKAVNQAYKLCKRIDRVYAMRRIAIDHGGYNKFYRARLVKTRKRAYARLFRRLDAAQLGSI